MNYDEPTWNPEGSDRVYLEYEFFDRHLEHTDAIIDDYETNNYRVRIFDTLAYHDPTHRRQIGEIIRSVDQPFATFISYERPTLSYSLASAQSLDDAIREVLQRFDWRGTLGNQDD